MKLGHEIATNEQLIDMCFSSIREMIGGSIYGDKVVKMSDQAVIKFGVGVKEQEANSQRIAFTLPNSNIVRV